MLQPFADARGAYTNRDWIPQGLASDTWSFRTRFFEAVNNAVTSGGRIYFNLDHVNIGRALKVDPNIEDSMDHTRIMTSWELQQILRTPHLYAYTEWWIGNQRLSSRDVSELGLDLIWY